MWPEYNFKLKGTVTQEFFACAVEIRGVHNARDTVPQCGTMWNPHAPIKKKIKFSSYMYKRKCKGSVAKSSMTKGPLVYR
jgi:hypothetical protein